MRLLAPLYALGALLALAPILIHLFGRDRAPRRRFPAARLLLAAQRRRAPRLRIEQWLLVALRTLTILAIVFSLARPIWQGRVALPAALGIRQSAVIVLDDSLSMQRRSGGGTLYARAQGEARDLVRAFAEGSEIAVLSTTGAAYDPLARLEPDRSRVIDAIDATAVSARAGSTTAALARAAALLQAAPAQVHRLYLVSDLAAHGFDAAHPRPFDAKGELGLSVIPVGDGPIGNDAVIALDVRAAADGGARRLRILARVRADGRPAHARTVSLLVDDRVVARGLVELPADGVAEKRFEYVIPAGSDPHWIDVALDADREDALALDDRRAAPIRGGAGRLVVVDGAPGASRREDGTFYLETALRAARGEAAPIDVVLEDDLPRAQLDDAVAVFLCNPRPSSALAQLLPFVQRGGGLFISVGDNLDPAALSEQLSALLPSSIEGIRDLSGPGGVAGGALRLERPSAAVAHRVPALVEERATDAWRAARSFRVALFRPLPGDDATREVLARFEDGTPALLERRVGAGRVIALSTSVDRAWSDLSIQPVFPPLAVELAGYLGAAIAGESESPVRIGVLPNLRAAAARAREVEVLEPDGKRERASLGDDQRYALPPVLLPGRYRVTLLDGPTPGPRPQLDYVGELDPAESDPTLLPDRDRLATPPPTEAPARLPVRELWHALAAALLALLFAEALLGLRG